MKQISKIALSYISLKIRALWNACSWSQLTNNKKIQQVTENKLKKQAQSNCLKNQILIVKSTKAKLQAWVDISVLPQINKVFN